MQIECAIFQERSIRIRAIRKHRAEADGRREIAFLVDEQLAPATQEARELVDECNSLETVVSELKVRYDNLCKAEKRQEAKFRGEFEELKQPMVEHLLRHYKKRPKLGRLTTTSVTYLTEVAKCIVSGDKSDILPRECLDFLRAMDALDTMPGNLPPQIHVNHWRMMCKLRRAKVELEMKVRRCNCYRTLFPSVREASSNQIRGEIFILLLCIYFFKFYFYTPFYSQRDLTSKQLQLRISSSTSDVSIYYKFMKDNRIALQ